MNQLLSMFGSAPRPVQAGVVLASGGGLLAAGSMLNGRWVAVFVAGLALVGLLLLGYRQLLKTMAARRAGPMERAIKGNAGVAPVGIAEPARRARLDDLRKNFEGGVQKFRENGKDLYAFPWYLLVGEPGSGKTEAIRHCNVGFPPGLQDHLQGAGGTLNMNWWFTNFAVILDTAGRLMFEEVEPGSTSEWQEFLKLLRRGRPDCPVNGLLLVIPAESLIKDSAETIEKKGGKIAQQLDNIQRVLGVRFPVYVVVTKCDLVNGFREFFDSISDPSLQHQMLGWSNPSPSLDTPFNPELVEQHLLEVKRRLERRRLGLLQDPVNTDDPRARRTDQIDAMYEFPEAFMDIAPRLRAYLQMVFVAGAWSAQPLFLRGIYFTSSMREGEALDAKLAEALGVSVESLPEGKVWDRERAFFLRDLFMSKVFKEKGLVTRSGNITRQQRHRRNLVYGLSAAGLALLIGFSAVGFVKLKRQVGDRAKVWQAVAGEGRNLVDSKAGGGGLLFPLVTYSDKVYYYNGKRTLYGLGTRLEEQDWVSVHRVLSHESDAGNRIGVPLVFMPFAWITGDSGGVATEEMRKTARAVFLASVVRPTVDAARTRLKEELKGSAEASSDLDQIAGALAQLLRVEVAGVLRSGKAARPELPEIEPLWKYVFSAKSGEVARDSALEDAGTVQEQFKLLYPGGEEGAEWPPADWAQVVTGDAAGAVKPEMVLSEDLKGWVKKFVELAGKGPPESRYARVSRLIQAVGNLDNLERQLQALNQSKEPPSTWAEEWHTRHRAIIAANDECDTATKAVGEVRSLTESYKDAIKERREANGKLAATVGRDLKLVDVDARAQAAKSSTAGKSRIANLEDIETDLGKLTKSDEDIDQATMNKEAQRLDPLYITNDEWLKRFAMYKAADEWLAQIEKKEALKPGIIGGRLATLESDMGAFKEEKINKVQLRDGAGDPKPVSTKAVEIGVALSRADLLGRVAREYPKTLDDLKAAIRTGADTKVPAKPPLPLTGSGPALNADYSPSAAAAYLRDYFEAGAAAAKMNGAKAGSEEPFVKLAADYLAEYVKYWGEGLTSVGGPLKPTASSWKDFQEALGRVSEADLISMLTAVSALQNKAAESVRALGEPAAVAGAADAQVRLGALESLARMTKEALSKSSPGRYVQRWIALGPEPIKARQSVARTLGTRAGESELYYSADGEGTAGSYLRLLTLEGFRLLADDPEASTNDAVAVLRRLGEKFPLVVWSKADDELNSEQVQQVRVALERVLPGLDAPEREGGVNNPDPCSQAGPLKDFVPKILNCDLTKAERKRFSDVWKRLELIPLPGSGETIKVDLINAEAANGVAAITLRQAVQLKGDGVTENMVVSTKVEKGKEAKLGALKLPTAGPVTLTLFTDPDGKVPIEQTSFDETLWLPLYLHDRYSSGPLIGNIVDVAGGVSMKWTGHPDAVYTVGIRLTFPGKAAPR